jgi:hypothetical protein
MSKRIETGKLMALTGVLRASLEGYSTPTIDARGRLSGARGQKGYIVWESDLPILAADLVNRFGAFALKELQDAEAAK